jgi:two-component system NtrC family sensor kinase
VRAKPDRGAGDGMQFAPPKKSVRRISHVAPAARLQADAKQVREATRQTEKYRYNGAVKISTRLTTVLLICVIPVIGAYMYFNVHQSTRAYVEDLTRETRATARALQAALGPDIDLREWGDVKDVLARVRQDDVAAALFGLDGKPMFMPADFPINPLPAPEQIRAALGGNGAEFMAARGSGDWFCRIVALQAHTGQPDGILLIGQRWNDVEDDLRARLESAVLASLLVAAFIAVMIPVVSHRYVARPLAELSGKVTRLSSEEPSDPAGSGDEVEFLTEEFRRLAEELDTARARLVDESERKLELERQLRRADKLAAIGTLASGLAHEIGTPLNVIRGRAEHLLSNRQNPPRTGEGLEIIITQIDRISRIVRMLLDLGSRRERNFTVCDLRPIVQRTIALLETEAARRRVSCAVNLGDEPLAVRCDADQLQQVFVNLGMNALDAMGSGGSLTVAAARTDANGRKAVRIVFADTGPGISPEIRARIFDPFFTTKEPGKGTGMGLAVSESIVRDHEGEIAIEAPQAGARIAVTLPLAEPLAAEVRKIA